MAIIIILFVWNIIGLAVRLSCNLIEDEMVNPQYVYKKYKMNIFGTVLFTIMVNLMCPIASIIYWIYKLCTIGRD